jgi:hypothetical protein
MIMELVALRPGLDALLPDRPLQGKSDAMAE